MISSELPKQHPNYLEGIKALTKLFRGLEKQDVRIIFEFSEYDVVATFKILTVLSVANAEKPAAIIKQLIDKPDKSDEVLNSLV